MSSHITRAELSRWLLTAAIAGALTGWIDTQSAAVQGPLLVLMLVNFALTLPGRAWPPFVTAASIIGFVIAPFALSGAFNVGMMIAALPALVAAYAGQFVGGLLHSATSELEPLPSTANESWLRQSLSTRALLATVLIAIAGAGFPIVSGALRSLGHPAAAWLAIIWQIVTLAGSVLYARFVLRRRQSSASLETDVEPGPSTAAVGSSALAIVGLAISHTIVLVALTRLLLIPVTPDWIKMSRVALGAYLPLDALTYLAVLTLAHASDRQRIRREGERRAASLRAETLGAHLAALRARLNPHFLFNALNSMIVLSRSGRAEQTARGIEGLTDMLRYVLDDRRAFVTLGEEMAFITNYLDVQRLRFAERLRVTLDVPESLRSVPVPQLILQPIVENAVEHGVGAALDGGEVIVRAVREGETLVLEVDDDGPGVSGALRGDGIGLSHTRERLARLYGDGATLLMTTRANAPGTRVVVRVPMAPASPQNAE